MSCGTRTQAAFGFVLLVLSMECIGRHADLYGQSASKGPPIFEVASIQLSTPGRGMLGILTYPGGRVRAGHCTLGKLIERAFDVQPFQVSGGPRWVYEEQYDIEAKPPESSLSNRARPTVANIPLNGEQRQMLLALLEERFRLISHRVTKQGPVYFLTKSDLKPKLTNPKEPGDFSWVGGPEGGMIVGTGIEGNNVSMPLLASRLNSYLGRPVLDRTGIQGFFNFKYLYDSEESHPDVVSSIFTSVRGLGLKLVQGKGITQTILIDHAEKPMLD